MRFVVFAAVALVGCPAELTEVCDLPVELPDVESGRGSATRSDGEAFDEDAFWSPGSNASVTIGLLSMVIAKDETGLDFDTLLADGALPICVPQGERSDTSGNSSYSDSPGFVTDAAHSGKVAVLSFDDDVLVGRFEVVVANPGSGATIEFTDGEFSAVRQ
jgi:hypothetical protein